MDIRIFSGRAELGANAAHDIAVALRDSIARTGHARVIFAAVPSQSDMIEALVRESRVDWSAVIAFHMDEYINEVPRRALTLTIPGLLAGRRLFCVVPGGAKATAVRDAIIGPLSTTCPASVLRRHKDCTLYLDQQSAALLDRPRVGL